MMQRYLRRREENSTIGLPRTFLIAVSDEIRRVLSPPYEVPLVMAINGALVYLAWAYLPRSATGIIFRYENRHALPAALAVWMMATVATTNLIGPDGQRMLWALDRPSAMGRMLKAKGLVVWMLLAVVVGAVDFSYGSKEPDSVVALLRTGIMLCAPLAAVGFGGLIGVLLPYKPIAVTTRIKDLRERPKRTLRWLACLVLPYVVMPIIGWLIMAVVIVVGLQSRSGHGSAERLDHYGALLGVFATLAIIVFVYTYRATVRLVVRRAPKIAELLIEPDQG